jgi:hypothetical protein
MAFKATKEKSNIPVTSIVFIVPTIEKTFDMHSSPSLTSRLVVAHRVVKFQDMMPNLKS